MISETLVQPLSGTPNESPVKMFLKWILEIVLTSLGSPVKCNLID